MILKKGFNLIFTVFMFLMAWGGIQATCAAIPPTETVKELLSTVQKFKKADKDKGIVLSSQDARTNAELSRRMNKILDIEGISAYALDEYWRQSGDQKRRAFMDLFTTLLEKVAYPNTGKFLNEVTFSVRNEKVIGAKAMVYTSVMHEKEGRIDIDFKLRTEGSDWRVEDVLLDGVSLARNLRTQSQKIIRDSSFEELLRRMRNKIENEDSDDFEDVTKRD